MKYLLSVCMIIKDERNLEELILFYWIQGVEHFYIYDNESSEPLTNRLNKYYIFTKICTIIPFPGKPQQVNSYNHCLQNYGNTTKWLAFLDADEYILPKHHGSFRDFVIANDHAHAIGINWVFFGTSFHEKKQDGFVIDKYRHTCNVQDQHIKTVCKPEFTINMINPHFVYLRDPSKYYDPVGNIIQQSPFNTLPGNSDVIQINHYYTRSLEESYEKQNRGRTDMIGSYDIPHEHQLNNNVIDNLCADKFLNLLNNQFEILHTNYLIYRALNPDLIPVLHDNAYNYYEQLYVCGLIENRPRKIYHKYPGFNLEFYRNNYADLRHLNNLDLELHYITIGVNENRVCDRLL